MDKLELPIYVDEEAWNGFAEMRVRIKKPMTPRAAKLILKELANLKTMGNDPNDCLDQSTKYNWLDVYPIRQKREASGRLPDYVPEVRRATAPPEGWANEIKAKLRSVK